MSFVVVLLTLSACVSISTCKEDFEAEPTSEWSPSKPLEEAREPTSYKTEPLSNARRIKANETETSENTTGPLRNATSEKISVLLNDPRPKPIKQQYATKSKQNKRLNFKKTVQSNRSPVGYGEKNSSKNATSSQKAELSSGKNIITTNSIKKSNFASLPNAGAPWFTNGFHPRGGKGPLIDGWDTFSEESFLGGWNGNGGQGGWQKANGYQIIPGVANTLVHGQRIGSELHYGWYNGNERGYGGPSNGRGQSRWANGGGFGRWGNVGGQGQWADVGNQGRWTNGGGQGQWANGGDQGRWGNVGGQGRWGNGGSQGQWTNGGGQGQWANVGGQGRWANGGGQGQWANGGDQGRWGNGGGQGQWANGGDQGQWANGGGQGQWANGGDQGQWANGGDQGQWANGGGQGQWANGGDQGQWANGGGQGQWANGGNQGRWF